jgi:hypothetical protein
MSQYSAPIDYIVDHILPNYSDTELSEMIAARTNKDSILYRAILRECGNRCAVDVLEYLRSIGIEATHNVKKT